MKTIPQLLAASVLIIQLASAPAFAADEPFSIPEIPGSRPIPIDKGLYYCIQGPIAVPTERPDNGPSEEGSVPGYNPNGPSGGGGVPGYNPNRPNKKKIFKCLRLFGYFKKLHQDCGPRRPQRECLGGSPLVCRDGRWVCSPPIKPRCPEIAISCRPGYMARCNGKKWICERAATTNRGASSTGKNGRKKIKKPKLRPMGNLAQ